MPACCLLLSNTVIYGGLEHTTGPVLLLSLMPSERWRAYCVCGCSWGGAAVARKAAQFMQPHFEALNELQVL